MKPTDLRQPFSVFFPFIRFVSATSRKAGQRYDTQTTQTENFTETHLLRFFVFIILVTADLGLFL